jgi:hypothetical protein
MPRAGKAKAAQQPNGPSGVAIADRVQASGHGSRRAQLEGRAQRLQMLLKRKKEGPETSIRLAETYIELDQCGRAKAPLEQCLKSDPADAGGARRVLAPLLLQLGHLDEATALLAQWSGDNSAVMLCSRLMLTLAAYGRGDAEECEADAAFDVAFAANWHACALLGAVSTGDSPIPENIVSELREQRLEALKQRDAAWPAAGGVQEAMLLSEQFAGFAGRGDEEPPWAGLDGADGWLCHKLLQQPPPTAATPAKTDSRKHVGLFEGLLEEIYEECQRILLEGDEEGDEGDEEEEAAEDEGEDEDDEESDSDDSGEEGSGGGARSRPALEAWKANKRAKLQAKLARAAPGGAVSDEEGSGDE